MKVSEILKSIVYEPVWRAPEFSPDGYCLLGALASKPIRRRRIHHAPGLRPIRKAAKRFLYTW